MQYNYTAAELKNVSNQFKKDNLSPILDEILGECYFVANNKGEFGHNFKYSEYGLDQTNVDDVANMLREKGFTVHFLDTTEMIVKW